MNYADQLLSDLAISLPMVTELFRKNRLDFCCGGKQTLKEACERKQIDLNSIVEELKKLQVNQHNDFQEKPLSELTSFIMERYHQDLRRRLPELITLSEKVERVHADHPDCPQGLFELLTHLHDEMLLHMMKEENVLFPIIDAGRGNMAQMPVKVMTSEHDAHGRQLDEIHRLTSDFVPPQDACTTWRALYVGLEKLEEELMEHIHLENNILFPRALAQSGK
ncbi:MAG: iron-sulfur cluster repair protein YtfE [Bacteriovoracia bacterium]